MSRRLSGVDAAFRYTGCDAAPMEVAYVCVLDPATSPEPFSFELVRTMLGQRLPSLPVFRRRMVEVPLGLDHPRWVDDPRFDLDAHVHRAAVPAPGDERQLAELAAQVLSRPLPADRPPWEMTVVEGLQDGQFGLVAKVHHAAIDGVSGAALLANLLDLEPVAVRGGSVAEWRPAPPPSPARLVGQVALRVASLPLTTARAAWEVGATMRSLLAYAREVGRDKVSWLPFGAPATRLGAPIHGLRRMAFAELPMADVRAVAKTLGVTVNDVILALCAAALRSWLGDHGGVPEDPLVAVVPVSVRTDDERDDMGNRLSAMFVPLATDVGDPVERVKRISVRSRAAKRQEGRAGLAPLAHHLSEATPPAVMAPALRMARGLHAVSHLRPANLVVSNVPGPDVDLYFAGARLRTVYPAGPVVDGMGLNITAQSYTGSLCFGLNACPTAVPDVWRLADGLEDALRDLCQAVPVG